MVHVLYIYLITSGIFFGYAIGSGMLDGSLRSIVLRSIFWLPIVLWERVRQVEAVNKVYLLLEETTVILINKNFFVSTAQRVSFLKEHLLTSTEYHKNRKNFTSRWRMWNIRRLEKIVSNHEKNQQR